MKMYEFKAHYIRLLCLLSLVVYVFVEALHTQVNSLGYSERIRYYKIGF